MNNKKYFKGNVLKEQSRNGWLLGHFMPTGLTKSSDLEIKIITLSKGFRSEPHYNKTSTKIDLIWKGKAIWLVDGREIIMNSGDYLVISPKIVVCVKKVLSDEIVVQTIKYPSVANDKVLV
jgi:quercetin dioxygenase-like cupin family protein